MKLTNDTNFHWRNYLRPTPPVIFWLFTTAEAVILTVNGTEILKGAKPWIPLTLLITQTVIGKLVLFFGRIKDEYEKKITVTSESPITVETKTGNP